MHYELYVDSLFFINFIMNLYLLILVDRSTFRTATPGRLITGAAAGALCFLLPFARAIPVAWKLTMGILIGTLGMLGITFRIRDLRMFLKLLERLLLYSFGMGGAMLFLIRVLRPVREHLTGVFGILGTGGVIFLLLCRYKPGMKTENNICRATLSRNGNCMTVAALIDSGNSLVEPVSGKPVCVVEREVFERLWEGAEDGFRAIPYHSIGKKRGIMSGYLLPGLQLEVDGMKLFFAGVYIAVSNEEISGGDSDGAESVKMIINPLLLEKSKKGSRTGRQNERRNDTESDDTGQNAV